MHYWRALEIRSIKNFWKTKYYQDWKRKSTATNFIIAVICTKLRLPTIAQLEIDEKTLTEIAGTTDGNYFRATSNSKLKEVYEEIDKLEKTKLNV